jgi:hypothetical protein
MNNLYYLGLWTYRGEGEEKKKIELDQVTDGNLADPWTREEMHRLLDYMISEVGRYVNDVDG